MTNLILLFCFVLLRSSEGEFALKCPILDTISLVSVELTSIYPIGIDTMYVLTGIYKTFPQKHLIKEHLFRGWRGYRYRRVTGASILTLLVTKG